MTQPPDNSYGEEAQRPEYGPPPGSAPQPPQHAGGQYGPPPGYPQQGYPQQGYPQSAGHPGYGQSPYGGSPQNIPNYLVQSILVMLFCCLPFGIVGLVHAVKVSDLVARGDYNGARQASESAKKWSLIGAICGGAVLALYVVFGVILVSSGHSTGSYNYGG